MHCSEFPEHSITQFARSLAPIFQFKFGLNWNHSILSYQLCVLLISKAICLLDFVFISR